MTGRRGEGSTVDPSGADPSGADPSGARPGGPDEPAETAGRVRAVLEEMFARITPIGAAFAAQRRVCLTAETELTTDRLGGLREIIWHQLGLLPAADGAGIVAAPGVVAGRERHLEWWQRTTAGDGGPDGYSRIRLNLDPESIDLYDYLTMDWFTVPRAEDRRYVYGPFIDFSGADRSILAMTIPVLGPGPGDASRAGEGSGNATGTGEFLGVAGADIRMSHLEPALLTILRALAGPAVLVTAERRVVAANTPRWLPGTRLDQLPRPGEDGFTTVEEIAADSGWLLGICLP